VSHPSLRVITGPSFAASNVTSSYRHPELELRPDERLLPLLLVQIESHLEGEKIERRKYN
jgi:hypothetical protein